MKKTLYLLAILATSQSAIQAEFTITQKIVAVITAIKNHFNPPAQEAPTIKVGYLAITKDIGHFEEDFMKLKKFADDPKIDAIIIVINSLGGSPGDSVILSEYIYEIKKSKPVIAFVANSGTSGAYLIACACTTIIASEMSVVGSIGGVHGQTNKDKYVYITSGKYKRPKFIDEGKAFDKDFEEYMQEYVNDHAATFIKKVALYRNLDAEFIKSLEAKCFTESQGIKIGLIDQIGTISDLIAKTVELVSEKTKKSYKKLNCITNKNEIYASFDLPYKR